MLPDILLLSLGDSAALSITDLDQLAQDIIKLLDVLIRSIHVLEVEIEQSVHDICAKVDKDLSIELNGFRVVLVTAIQDSTCLEGLLLFADLQAFVNREVAP